MSLKWLNTVWNKSKQKGGDLLGLMAIADEANDDGIAKPNINNIAHKMRMNERTASRIVTRISHGNELAVALNPGYRSTYCILVDRAPDEISAIREWMKLLVTTPDKMSPPPRQFVAPAICRPDKMSGRFLSTPLKLINPPNRLINSSSSSDDEDDEFCKMLKAAGVWKRDIQAVRTSDITIADFMAELSRCYQDPKVRKPARISVMNLLRGDRPSATWYEKETWINSIPQEVLKVGCPLLLEQDKSSEPITHSGYANEHSGEFLKAERAFIQCGVEHKILSVSDGNVVMAVPPDTPDEQREYLERYALSGNYIITLEDL